MLLFLTLIFLGERLHCITEAISGKFTKSFEASTSSRSHTTDIREHFKGWWKFVRIWLVLFSLSNTCDKWTIHLYHLFTELIKIHHLSLCIRLSVIYFLFVCLFVCSIFKILGYCRRPMLNESEQWTRCSHYCRHSVTTCTWQWEGWVVNMLTFFVALLIKLPFIKVLRILLRENNLFGLVESQPVQKEILSICPCFEIKLLKIIRGRWA